MPVKSLAPYEFPSRSAVENYDGDMLVNIFLEDSDLLACAAMVRVPQDMTWQDFYQTQFLPLAQADPDYDVSGGVDMKLVDDPFNPSDDKSLTELGIEHKNTITVTRR